MIRKLCEQDREIALQFLSDEPCMNLFLIGDIENFGFGCDFQEVWGQFIETGELEGILLRFHNNFIPYYKNEHFDNEGFKQIIKYYKKGNAIISGKDYIVKKYRYLFPYKKVKNMYFCEMRDNRQIKSSKKQVKIASVDDAERICKMIDTIDEFSNASSPSIIKQKIVDESGRVYYIEDENGEIISVSQTTAENSKSAIVVGVATKKEHRRKGHMNECLSKLCKDVLAEGKVLCLFYDNPEAGSVYHKMGFNTIGKWMIII
jgi:predicted GNAT family acetyltransferase